MNDESEPPSPASTAHMGLRLLIRAKREPAARRVVAQLGKQIGHDLQLQTCEPYRKDPTLLEVRALAPVSGSSREAIVYEVLRATASLHSDRFVGGPSEYDGGKWEIHIHATARKDGSLSGVPGLVWLECRVGSVDEERPATDDHRT